MKAEAYNADATVQETHSQVLDSEGCIGRGDRGCLGQKSKWMMRHLPCDSRVTTISAEVSGGGGRGKGEGLEGSLVGTIGVGEVGRRKAVTEEVTLALSAVIVSPSLHFGSLGLCSLF